MRAVVHPGPACGSVRAPASKSVAHRAVLAAALAQGETVLEGVSPSADLSATLAAARAFGAAVRPLAPDAWQVRGVPLPQAPSGPVDCGESGSTLRFLIPLLALTGAEVTLTGRGRLPQRPQEVYQQLFSARGLPFAAGPAGLCFRGPLTAGEYRLSGAVSSQFITGLLLALPLLDGDSLLRIEPPFESRPYVELTLDVLARFGIAARWRDSLSLSVPGGQRYRPVPRFAVEGDYSQAAFFAALGALAGRVECTGLRPGSAQGDRAIFEFLARMGTPAARAASALVCRRAPLRPGVFDLADCPDLGPILTVLCCFCDGVSRIEHVGRLRYKESDRIAAMQAELSKLGLTLRCEGDALVIPGIGERACRAPAEPLSGWNDHRVVMALAVAASRTDGPVTIEGAEAVEKSYPRFFEDLQSAGVRVELSV